MRASSTLRRIEPHATQSEQRQTSEAANSHYTIIPADPHFSLKHFLMTEQTNPKMLSVWLSGGQISNHISVLLFYVWAGGRRCGTWGTDERGRGVEGLFAENIIAVAPVTLSVRLCCASLCAFAGPLRCFVKQGAGPLRRCLCSLCGSTTQRGARLALRPDATIIISV